MSDIQSLTAQALADVAAAQNPETLENLRVSLLGKSGSITAQLKQLGTLPPDARKAAGEAINVARDAVSTAGLGIRMRMRPESLVTSTRASGSTGPGSSNWDWKCCEEDVLGVRVS